MLFSAGMGIGLVFWGVAEPLNHFASPRPSFEGTETEAAAQAITTTYLHWGVHAWAIYVVVGLAMAYAVHRRGRPVSIRWALEPLIGERVARGPVGDVVDVVAVVGTLFGVATSLGFGVLQLAAGLDFVGVPADTVLWQVVLVALVTGLAVLSVVTGLGQGHPPAVQRQHGARRRGPPLRPARRADAVPAPRARREHRPLRSPRSCA